MAEFKSPGGFVFGVQGWNPGESKPTGITFFTDGTVRVTDQFGNPIDDFRGKSHVAAIGALTDNRIDWQKLDTAGWPQIPYAELKKLPNLPDTPAEELRKIKDPALRKDALRARRELDDVRDKQLQEQDAE